MKRNFIIILLFSVGFSMAQTNAGSITKRKADVYFKKMAYVKASKLYEKIVETEPSLDVYSHLADCYYFNSKMYKAVKWYKLLMNNYKYAVNPEYYIKYALALKGIGFYNESNNWMKLFYDKNPTDSRAIKFYNNENYLKKIKYLGKRYKIKNAQINTRNSDFGAAFYGSDKLIIASAKKRMSFLNRTYAWNDLPFLSLYKATINVDGNLSNLKLFSNKLLNKNHEAMVAFTKNQKTIYFTQNNKKKNYHNKDSVSHLYLKLYRARLIDNKWKNSIPLPFNGDGYSVGHPTLSADGKTLYFISDMPGTIGKTDIFKVAITKKDGIETYGKPVNLGKTINTEGREMFPFISKNNILYFSSDGHLGLGGLDVFMSKLKNGKFSKPINIGEPINGPKDDFAFLINDKNKTGYFSSNRIGGKGDDDIYWFKETKPYNECHQQLEGVVTDKLTKKVLPNALLTLFNKSKNKIDSIYSSKKGLYKMQIDCFTYYNLMGSKNHYYPVNKELLASRNSDSIIKAPLALLPDEFMQKRNKLMIKINPIYFDLDSWTIGPDAKKELDKIVSIMKKYPNMIIESGSHTDSRGSDKYNQWLSEKRVRSTVEYIVYKGINHERIYGKGYGETQLVNKCANGVKCTEAQHQLNRRTEFVVVKQ